MEKNFLLTIEYDGSGFSGWQRQPEERTVQGTLEALLSDLAGHDITIDGTSRTDAGVHAEGQMASFKADIGIPAGNLAKVLNDRLSGRPEKKSTDGDIRIKKAEEVSGDFHARKNAVGKSYRYLLRNADSMPVFDRNYRYLVPGDLDIEKMQDAAKHIVGTHDFICFQAAGGEPGKTTVRTIASLDITERRACGVMGQCVSDERNVRNGRDISIDIKGDGFLYNMVRIIVGTLIEVGQGKRDPEDIKMIIESRDRTKAGHTAPACGLCLEKVFY